MTDPRYLPDRETLPNGVIAETYGRAHAARQADAEALMDGISWAGSAIVTTVRCACKRRTRLATVYRTVPAVIRIDPVTHADPNLVEIRRDLDSTEIVYATDVFLDILDAPDDRDLFARCRNCGRHELDRAQIRDAYVANVTDIIHGR